MPVEESISRIGRRRFLGATASTASLLTISPPVLAACDSKSGTGAQPNGAAAPDDGSVLPILPKPFDGKVGDTYADSTPEKPEILETPEGAPNVLMVLIDDTGFGHASTFGGPVSTPTLQRLADDGLRYNRFHTTAPCVRRPALRC